MDLYDVSDIISTSLDDLGIQLDCNNTTEQSTKDTKERYTEKPVVPQVRAGEFGEDVDDTLTDIENAKYASVEEPITKDNYYSSTACNWSEVDKAPEGKPDYTSDSGSKYWYTEQGVYRESDHWGFGVGSCDWTLNSNPELSHRDEEGDRIGFAQWKDFKHTDEKTFPQIVEMLTPKEAGLEGETDQQTEVFYDNYRSRQIEPKEDFVEDVTFPAGIETRFYTECAAEGAGESAPANNVVNPVNENVVNNVSNKITDPVSGQNGSPRNYTNKKPGETAFRTYTSFELTTIDKVAEEIEKEADLESKKPYLLKDLEKSKFDKKDYEDVISICNDMDPTGDKAVYTQWILRHHVLNEEPISGYDSIEYLQKFTDLKKSKKLQNADADINQYKSFEELKNKVDQILGETGGYTSKRNEEKTKAEEGIKKLDQDGDLELYLVNTPEAAAEAFRFTDWCVKDPKFYESYAKIDPNFYYFKKGGTPYLLLHASDYKDAADNRPSEDQLLDIRKLLQKNNLLTLNGPVSLLYLREGYISPSDELFDEVVESIMNDGYWPHLLYDKIITRYNRPELFKQLVEKEITRSLSNTGGAYNLLRDGIITKEDGELFTKAVDSIIENSTRCTRYVGRYLNVKDDRDVFEKAIKTDIERGWTDYLIDEEWLKIDDFPELFDKCVKDTVSQRPYVGLNWIKRGILSKEKTPEQFDYAIMTALAGHNDEYILQNEWITEDELEEYKRRMGEQLASETTEDQPMDDSSNDDTNKESSFEYTDINKLADMVQEFNRQDELTEDQLNRFVNRSKVTDINEERRDELKEDTKQTGKVITYIPKSTNYPYIEDEMGTNQINYSGTDWLEMCDLSEM